MKKRGVAKPNSKLAYLKDLEKFISTWRTKGNNHEVILMADMNEVCGEKGIWQIL